MGLYGRSVHWLHMSALPTAYIAFGSNLSTAAGDPAATIRAALRALVTALGVEESRLHASSLYATTPVAYRDQPPFINAVASVCTSRSPEELMAMLLEVERLFGRERSAANGPRTLDLDLLLVGGLVLTKPGLVLPHPRMAERRFVLKPLAEIAPGLVHPVLGRTVAELLAVLPDEGEQARSGVRRLGRAIGW